MSVDETANGKVFVICLPLAHPLALERQPLPLEWGRLSLQSRFVASRQEQQQLWQQQLWLSQQCACARPVSNLHRKHSHQS